MKITNNINFRYLILNSYNSIIGPAMPKLSHLSVKIVTKRCGSGDNENCMEHIFRLGYPWLNSPYPTRHIGPRNG
jgi:hypothetical protein